QPGGVRPGAPVGVAHDEDRVGPTTRGRGLDRVVADRPERVERDLVAAMDLVEGIADRPPQGDEAALAPARERLEVEVDAVGATIADGGGDLPGEVAAGGRRAGPGALPGGGPRRPAGSPG